MKANFEKLNVEIFGSSHADKIGLRLCGVPVGTRLTLGDVQNMLLRRKGGAGIWTTARAEEDLPRFVEGLEKVGDEYVVTGDIVAEILNRDVRSADYDLTVPRPSHADYAAYCRDGSIAPGGGRFSGRMTAPLCIAGGIAKELLRSRGIRIGAYISSVKDVRLASYDGVRDEAVFDKFVEHIEKEADAFPTLDGQCKAAVEAIKCAGARGDSVGGTIECVALGVKAGSVGDALFEGLEGKLAYSIFAVPAVKGVEFGKGFAITTMCGSEANDAFLINNGEVRTATNNSGGINGGIANGMPITLRVAIKPTPSIAIKQQSVDLSTMSPAELEIVGRHDACIVPRAVPCVESAVALALADEALKYGII